MSTIEALDQLEQVAFTTEQAKAIVGVIENRQEKLATKEDVKPLAIREEMLKMKYDIVKWIVGSIVANGAIVAIMLKLLP